MTTAAHNPNAIRVTLVGVIDGVSWLDEESGAGMLKLKVDKEYGHYPCVGKSSQVAKIEGAFAKIGIGERVEVTGTIKNHPKWGPKVVVEETKILEPKTLNEIARYLAVNVNLIGPKLSKDIVARFGEDTFNVIDNEPRRLLEIPLINEKRLGEILDIWEQQRNFRKLLVFATSIGLSSKLLTKIFKKYKDKAVEKIKENPYRLARDIWGVGFAKADEVARHLGVHEMAPMRIIAGIEHCIAEASEKIGDTFVYSQDLVKRAVALLANPQITEELVTQCLVEGVRLNNLIADENRIYLPDLYWAELRVARKLSEIMGFRLPDKLTGESLQGIADRACQKVSFPLDPKQREAIYRSLGSKVSVITGGPGTGKTTITQCVFAGFREVGMKMMLMAPTGRAAQRMMEVIGADATTIHRITWSYRRARQDGQDVSNSITGIIFLDESSMIDIKLMDEFLELVNPASILVVIGDKDQLPSVAAGAVLRDLIESRVVPTSMLTHIFRQAKGSNISLAAAAINAGQMPELHYFGRMHGIPDSDFMTAIIDDAEKQADAVLYCATQLCRNHFGMDPVKDCMVLSPMHKGVNGVGNLNAILQRSINPEPPVFVDRGGGIRWGVGDKIMQTSNDKDLEVSNGDVGIIQEIWQDDGKLKKLVVNISGRDVEYADSDKWMNLQLAYASTIHKVQGSESPMVIMVLGINHWPMLARNMLYTGITRGKKRVLLITEGRALSRAITNNDVARRNTWLAERIRSLRAAS